LVPISLVCFTRGIWAGIRVFNQLTENERFTQEYREYEFTRANFFEMLPDVRDWWDECTRELNQLGFSLLGDYQLRDRPYQIHDRMYWHESGTTLGVACAVTTLDMPDIDCRETKLTLEFTSSLSDGTNICTVSIDRPDRWGEIDPDADRLQINCIPGTNVDELFAHHRDSVADCARARNADVLVFADEQHQAIVIYNQRLFHTWLHRQKMGPAAPPVELPVPLQQLTVDQFLATTDLQQA
jgi:hypothetical protein